MTDAVRELMPDGTFGVYETVVRRWERITRPAPAPTTLNRNGRPHLSLAFDEWMMGLAAGYVTRLGLARKHVLKILGNGVVPQQAEAAFDNLLDEGNYS